MMAFFLRTRRLDLAKLEVKPQESLEVVHAILTATIKTVLQKLSKLERSYYGRDTTAEMETKIWAGPVCNTMKAMKLSNITTSWQIDDLIIRANDPQNKFTIDLYEVNKLKECYRKIKDAVPHKFKDLIIELKKVLKYLTKYCLSFYDLDTDVKLDTAIQYEQQIQSHSNEIRNHLEHIETMEAAFEEGGYYYSDLSALGQELARKADCNQAPFILMFPEACENIREACRNMTSWLHHDANYATYLAHDITDIEKLKTDALKVLKGNQDRYHKIHFRVKHARTELEKYDLELARLSERENELLVEQEYLVIETNEMGVEIEVKEYRRDELIKNAAHTHPEVLYEKYSELSEDIRALKVKWPLLKRQLNNARNKLTWIVEKKCSLQTARQELTELESEIDELENNKLEQEVYIADIQTQLDLARRIHLYKSSSDAIAKIFYQQPVVVNYTRLPGKQGSEDPFERACHVVNEMVEDDWPKLYRRLPFVPARGIKTVDEDIAEFTQEEARVGVEETAKRCLTRWRRFHTRAKLEDLKETLALIRRSDILERMEEVLNPPLPPEPEDEQTLYGYVEPELIPFLKEVERFDALKAMGKFEV